MDKSRDEFFAEQGVLSLHAKPYGNGVRLSVGVETFCDGTEWNELELDEEECRTLGQMLLESAAYSNHK